MKIWRSESINSSLNLGKSFWRQFTKQIRRGNARSSNTLTVAQGKRGTKLNSGNSYKDHGDHLRVNECFWYLSSYRESACYPLYQERSEGPSCGRQCPGEPLYSDAQRTEKNCVIRWETKVDSENRKIANGVWLG